jgi:hypothetical protein
MAESAALLVDEVLPEQPMRQWVLSFPYPLRFLFVTYKGFAMPGRAISKRHFPSVPVLCFNAMSSETGTNFESGMTESVRILKCDQITIFSYF